MELTKLMNDLNDGEPYRLKEPNNRDRNKGGAPYFKVSGNI